MLYRSYHSQNASVIPRYLVVILACLHQNVHAAPGSGYGLSRRQMTASQTSNTNNNLSPEIWVRNETVWALL